jgi:hypothetical protein
MEPPDRRNGDRCYLSAVTLTEIAYGVAWLRGRGATARATRLGTWLEQVLHHHESRILPVDTEIALQAGVLMATATAHGLEVLTFNMADFQPMAVVCRDPSVDLPEDAGD